MGKSIVAQIPLDVSVRTGGDKGQPIVISYPQAPAAVALVRLSQIAAGRLAIINHAKPEPAITDPLLRFV